MALVSNFDVFEYTFVQFFFTYCLEGNPRAESRIDNVLLTCLPMLICSILKHRPKRSSTSSFPPTSSGAHSHFFGFVGLTIFSATFLGS